MNINEKQVKIGSIIAAAGIVGTGLYVYSLARAGKRMEIDSNFSVGFNLQGLSSALLAEVEPIVNNPTAQVVEVGHPFVKLYASEQQRKEGKKLGVSTPDANKTPIAAMGQTRLRKISIPVNIRNAYSLIKDAIAAKKKEIEEKQQKGEDVDTRIVLNIIADVEIPVYLKWSFLPPVILRQTIKKDLQVPSYLLNLLPSFQLV